jgi:hypothetical protein
VLREAGYTDLDEDGLLAELAAATEEEDPLQDVCGCGSALVVELHTAIEPLAPHLLAPGLTRLLTQGALVALADGRYRAAERSVLRAIGQCLGFDREDTDATLAVAARTLHP